MSLRDLIFFTSKAAPKDKILLASPTKDDAADSLAYMIQSANAHAHMPGAKAMITNIEEPDGEICRFEMQELEAVLSGRKEPADEEG